MNLKTLPVVLTYTIQVPDRRAGQHIRTHAVGECLLCESLQDEHSSVLSLQALPLSSDRWGFRILTFSTGLGIPAT